MPITTRAKLAPLLYPGKAEWQFANATNTLLHRRPALLLTPRGTSADPRRRARGLGKSLDALRGGATSLKLSRPHTTRSVGLFLFPA